VLPRFFAPEAGATGPLVTLPEDEAQHLSRVLRLAPGARVHVFDGQGHEWQGDVDEVSRQRVAIKISEPVAPAPESRIPIVLAIAILKGVKMDDVVRDAVMLGAAAIRPLVTDRTEIGLATIAKSDRARRWRRIAVASAKQCGRAVVPRIHDTVTLDTYLGAPPDGARLMLVEPGASAHGRDLRSVQTPAATDVMIGPEGGWTGAEVAAADRAGASLVTLGGPTLRADAVPLVALTALRVLWNDL